MKKKLSVLLYLSGISTMQVYPQITKQFEETSSWLKGICFVDSLLKKLWNLFYFIIIISLLHSCSKEESPGCNINGLWIGGWQSTSKDSGTFFTDVTQQSNEFNGWLDVGLFSTDYQNYSSDYSGSVKEKNIRSTIIMEDVDIKVNAIVQDDSIISGNFDASSLNMNGSFKGSKLLTSFPEINKIDINSLPPPGKRVSNLLCVEDHLWIFTYPYEFIGNIAKEEVIITDLKGNVTGQTYFPSDGGSLLAFDGVNIWIYENNYLLEKFDIKGNKLNAIGMDKYSLYGVFASKGSNLYFSSHYKLYKTDQSATILDIINLEYINNAYIFTTYKDYFLVSIGKFILEFDQIGKLLKGFVIPIEKRMRVESITTNNDKIFCLVCKYGENGPESDSYTVFDVTI